MRIGQRQRHRDLTIVLLAKLPAILPRHPDRMPALLGKARIVDDPSLDRSMPLNRRQNHLPHFRKDLLVRPASLPNKMQQRLMLSGGPFRRRRRRHRLNALALDRRQQADAIIPQRPRPVRVTDHADKPLNIGRKPRLAALAPKLHASPKLEETISSSLGESPRQDPAAL